MKALSFVLSLILITGCSTFNASHDEEKTTTTYVNGEVKTVVVENKDIDVWRGNVFMNASVESVGVEYGNVKVNVGNFQQAGDYKSIEATGNAIVNGIVAWMTYGTAPAVKGAVMASLVPTQPSACTNAPAVK
jgi:hypothetical protein